VREYAQHFRQTQIDVLLKYEVRLVDFAAEVLGKVDSAAEVPVKYTRMLEL
jgi:hypothetical protein